MNFFTNLTYSETKIGDETGRRKVGNEKNRK